MRKGVLVLLAIVCVVLSPFASSLPDGLETVLEGQHLASFIQELTWPIFTDYHVSIVSHPLVAGWLAGGIGIVIVGFCAFAILTLQKRRRLVKKIIS